MPMSITYFYRTLVFEWYVIWRGLKNKYKKDMCLKEIGLCAQNMITILSSTINIIGGDLYNELMSTRIFTSMMNKIFI